MKKVRNSDACKDIYSEKLLFQRLTILLKHQMLKRKNPQRKRDVAVTIESPQLSRKQKTLFPKLKSQLNRKLKRSQRSPQKEAPRNQLKIRLKLKKYPLSAQEVLLKQTTRLMKLLRKPLPKVLSKPKKLCQPLLKVI